MVGSLVLARIAERLPGDGPEAVRRHPGGEREETMSDPSLEVERDLIAGVLDTVGALVVVVDREGRIVRFNRMAERVTGYAFSEVSGRTFWSLFVRPEEVDRVRETFDSFRPGEFPHLSENEWVMKDATRRLIAWSYTALPDPAGHVQYVISTGIDITERRHLELQLRQAQKMEAIGRLAGGVAHDFNNLLTAIIGYSELMLVDAADDPRRRRNVAEIRKAAERAAALTRQLLAFSRKQVLQPTVLDLNDVVSNVDGMLRRLIGEHIELVTQLDPAIARVKVDPGQVEQIILNLAINARDAMPQGGRLIIETATVELDDAYVRDHVPVEPGSYVMLAVSDTGCGMDADTRSHIFEPFFTTKERGKGTGLGLATVYGIVKQSGGYIWVYSEPSHGTTFKIYLPRVDRLGGSLEPRAIESRMPAVGSETVLVAEDDEAVRTLACEILRAHGYRLLQARNGREALSIAEEYGDQIHLLLTDSVMPEMSGRRLAQQLASRRPEMKVVYMSGYTDLAVLQNGMLERGATFIQKPFTPAGLTKKIREVLDLPTGA